MDVGDRDNLIPPDRPFALLCGMSGDSRSPEAVESALRRMGLQPQSLAVDGSPDALFHLSFGGLGLSFGRAQAAQLDHADPIDRATSLIGLALRDDWRGHCWFVRPDTAVLIPHAFDRAPLQQFLKALVLLIDLFDADHLFWSPAALWSDARHFRGAIAEMQASGMPPVLHLIAFRRRDDGGADGTVATRGLAAFAGQELVAPVPPGWDMASMVKRLARLALDTMLNGAVARARRTPGLLSGEWVALTPQSGGKGRPATVLVEFSDGR